MTIFRAWVASLIVCIWPASYAFAEQATVAVAANFTHAMNDILQAFEGRTDHTVRRVTGSSGKLYVQIKHGAPYHAFFSADQNAPAMLEQDGLVAPGSRFTYAIGRLVLWSPKPDLVDAHGKVLEQQNWRKLAIANPRVAPYGAAAVEAMEHLGVRKQAQPRWVQGENISQAYQFVASGNADLGFVALAQLLATGNAHTGSLWPVPSHYHRPIKQGAVLLRAGESNKAAVELLQFMRSETARKIIAKHGYRLEQPE